MSWADSISFSHVDSAIVDLLREGLTTLNSRNRLLFGIAQFRFNSNSYRGWATRSPRENECRTSYEKLVSSGAAEFIRIVRFLGWPVPDEQVANTVERHSFLARSGRRPGETDIHSHYRRGISGDWRNHFDRRVGELFERALPGLVAAGAYEASNEWYRRLPERIPSLTDTEPESLPAAP